MMNRLRNIVCLLCVGIMLHHCGVEPGVDTGGASETVAIVINGLNIDGETKKTTEDNVEMSNPDVILTLYDKVSNWLPNEP